MKKERADLEKTNRKGLKAKAKVEEEVNALNSKLAEKNACIE